MSRDSLFGESILWQGRPKGGFLPARYRTIAAVLAILSVVSVAFAVVAATAIHAHVGGMLAFAAWCATLALAAWRGPLLWEAGVEYLITDKHVIWRRGPIRRTIDRAAISYALIRWNPRAPGTGDLVLVRAVPTGALRRTLSLTLSDVVGPDRLWAIVRGLTPGMPLGDGDRPLAQRLDNSCDPAHGPYARAARRLERGAHRRRRTDGAADARPRLGDRVRRLPPARTPRAADSLPRDGYARPHPARPRGAAPRSRSHRVRDRGPGQAAPRRLPRARRTAGARAGRERCLRRAHGRPATPRARGHRGRRDRGDHPPRPARRAAAPSPARGATCGSSSRCATPPRRPVSFVRSLRDGVVGLAQGTRSIPRLVSNEIHRPPSRKKVV